MTQGLAHWPDWYPTPGLRDPLGSVSLGADTSQGTVPSHSGEHTPEQLSKLAGPDTVLSSSLATLQVPISAVVV